MGFGSRQLTRVPLLNACHRAALFAWARKCRDWNVEDWKRLAWCDESRFRIINANGNLRIWPSVRVPTSLNEIRYVDMLGTHLHAVVMFCYPSGNGVFQQDKSTSPKTRLGTGW
ncbi:transposable element Tc1 transposase [Trichonephila clavipes]|nr:transposable element Tc1 transposase [Trichonephila clavipes]